MGRIEHASKLDVALIQKWASSIDGRILDVGSGPGQWTNCLREFGADVEGVDPAPEFIERARRDYPETEYRVGDAEHLEVEEGALGGVLAWYSLIHILPSDIGRSLSEFARAVRPGGGILLGFFTADHQSSFNHAIAAAYYWPVEMLVRRVEEAGFEVTHTETRGEQPERMHGALTATRVSVAPSVDSEKASVFHAETA